VTFANSRHTILRIGRPVYRQAGPVRAEFGA
jgi:hypothetical protein